MKIQAVLIILLAAFLRLYELGKVPLFYDESIHSYFANLVLKGAYSYNPAYHGPLLFYSVAPVIAFFGESEFTLRLIPAVLGTLFVASILLYRRFIGNSAIFAAIFAAVSPVIVNYSRFYREDVYQLLFTSLAIYFILCYLEKKKSWKELKVDRDSLYLIFAAIFLAFFASVKETFYIFAALIAVYLALDLKRIRSSDLLISAVVFLTIYLCMYSNFFTSAISEFPAIKAISYWKYQHDIARISGPPYYFLELLLLYDLPLLILAFIAVKRWLKERDEFKSMFIFLFFTNLIFYSYMQEKVPWLLVHIEFPMIMLAATAVGKRSFVLSTIYLLYGCVFLNFVNPVNPAEPALYLPTQFDVKEARKFEGKISIVARADEYWPLVWYLKGKKVYYSYVPDSDIIIANYIEASKIEGEWKKENLVVRCWTFWTNPSIEKIPEFLIFRKPLAEVYCLNFTIFRKIY
ncbi:MAG: TIGR03663 family protein [Archaeoglobaceae archaeon]|nr:TIGR03663 family protein [Archaeoglobaceae archaeon]MCX8152757.1 TIGR03663 family protein [Archaeoglobaceae archaeon]MDW8013464.1 TIGR03663 family protein [Archaeoglobaceae archaeon]